MIECYCTECDWEGVLDELQWSEFNELSCPDCGSTFIEEILDYFE